MGVTAGDAGTYTAFADNGLGPPATAAVSLSVDPASSDGGTNVPASVIELEPGKKDRQKTHERREKCTSSSSSESSSSLPKLFLAHHTGRCQKDYSIKGRSFANVCLANKSANFSELSDTSQTVMSARHFCLFAFSH